jgi:hypothetical protein
MKRVLFSILILSIFATAAFGQRVAEIYKELVIVVTDAGGTNIVNAESISGGGEIEATLVTEVTDTPRNLRYTLTDNANPATVTVTVTVDGTDQFGRTIQEVKSLDAVTDDAVAREGVKVFSRVTAVTLTGIANEAASDTLSVGYGRTLGLASDLRSGNSLLTANKGAANNAGAIDLDTDSYTPEGTSTDIDGTYTVWIKGAM